MYKLNKGTLTVTIEGQGPFRQPLYNYNNNSDEKQVKEIVPTWSQSWFFSAAILNEINQMEKDKYYIVSGSGVPFRA